MITISTLVLLSVGDPAARAHDALLEYSRDGVTWLTTPPDVLFVDDVVLVPGGAAIATVHLRSAAPDTGALTLRMKSAEVSDDAVSKAFGMSFEMRSEGRVSSSGGRYPMADLEEGTEVVPMILVDPGQDLTLTVTVELDAEVAGRAAQGSTVALTLALQFADASAGHGGGHWSVPPVVIPVLPGTEAAPSGASEEGLRTDGPLPPIHPSPDACAQSHDRGKETSANSPETAGHQPWVLPLAPVAPASTGPLAVTGSALRVIGALATALIIIGALLLRSRQRQERS